MVQKATVLGAPLLAAISGPTGLAVRVAEQAGLTLVGFARRGRATVYTHPQRVVAGSGMTGRSRPVETNQTVHERHDGRDRRIPIWDDDP